MAGSGGKGSGGKGGAKSGSGKASNAALQDDEDVMARRGKIFREWASGRKRKRRTKGMMIDYENSPEPPKRKL